MASLYHPCGIFVSNGEVYIADKFNHRVRKLLRNGQTVTICGTGIAGSVGDGQLATDAQLYYPHSVVVSSSNQVYISETGRIRKIDRNGVISTIAGTGVSGWDGDGQLAIHAQVCCPSGLFVNEDEEVLFADSGNHLVRKIDRYGIMSTIAGIKLNTTDPLVDKEDYLEMVDWQQTLRYLSHLVYSNTRMKFSLQKRVIIEF